MKTINLKSDWQKINLPPPVLDIIQNSRSVIFPSSREQLVEMALGGKDNSTYDVCYEVEGKGTICEASIARCKNGVAVNYNESYMRRRDPDCMLVGDDNPSDKQRYKDKMGHSFDAVRNETFEWLKRQDLSITTFYLGEPHGIKYGGLMIAPKNAGFFIAGLADLQGMLDPENIPDEFDLRCVLYIAPPFRHTHFSGKQVVVHNRLNEMHEIFSYNLYPGPSAKKGVYGALLTIGEAEEWLTLHASTVQAVTPYDNTTTIMHEGASGSGKSEMLEQAHREEDGRLLFGKNTVNGEELYITLNQTCSLHPVTDDMAMCPQSAQNDSGYIVACDAEQAWFVRLNHIARYGTDPNLEKVTISPKEPLIFLSLQGVPQSTVLIWEHTEDSPGVPCPNPRVILPRRVVPDCVDGIVEVNIRNFGIRTPPCTRENPTYGVVGLLHILPPALAWLWRLVSPRGFDNPSITDTAAMTSEGVGSYWPFATGKFVNHANLLLRQIEASPQVGYTLTPNQHIGAYRVSFMPQWISREYLARRGVAKFKPEQLVASRCSLLGHTLHTMQVEGVPIPHDLLRVNEQPEVGDEGYDKGAEILRNFFISELEKFEQPELDDLGKKIIQCCMDKGTAEDYSSLL